MSRLDLNIHMDDVARRLSFSDDSPPKPKPKPKRKKRLLPPIAEHPGEQQAAGTPSASSPWTSPPPRPLLQAPGPVTCCGPAMNYPLAPSVVRSQHIPVCSAVFVDAIAVASKVSSEELDRRREAKFQQQQQKSCAAAGRQPRAQQQMCAAAGGQPRPQQQTCAAARGQPRPQQQMCAAAGGQPQQLRLYTVEGNPVGHKTKWDELHPASQELLLQIEENTRVYKYQSEQLDNCSRLYDPSVSNKGFELNASQITQEIGSISTIMYREKASIQRLMSVIEEIMRNTDFVTHSYVNLKRRSIRRTRSAGFGKSAGPSGARTDFNQPLTKASTFHYYRGDVMRPSLFMQQIVARFEMRLEECCRMIGELEQVVQMNNDKTYPDALKSLPKVMSNTHDYFIHVAAKVENLHLYAQAIRTRYLNHR